MTSTSTHDRTQVHAALVTRILAQGQSFADAMGHAFDAEFFRPTLLAAAVTLDWFDPSVHPALRGNPKAKELFVKAGAIGLSLITAVNTGDASEAASLLARLQLLTAQLPVATRGAVMPTA